jgi:UDP-N-acetylglucosamine transferase subunit ALG13
MIFVITGTNGPPFDRLLLAVEAFDTNEPLLVQHGPSTVRPARAKCVAYLSFAETIENIREARLVVTHGGVGSILICLANGKRPFVVPRRARDGEVSDDHQVEFGQRLGEEGLAVYVGDPVDLPEALRTYDDVSPEIKVGGGGPLTDDLHAYLAGVVSPRMSTSP